MFIIIILKNWAYNKTFNHKKSLKIIVKKTVAVLKDFANNKISRM